MMKRGWRGLRISRSYLAKEDNMYFDQEATLEHSVGVHRSHLRL